MPEFIPGSVYKTFGGKKDTTWFKFIYKCAEGRTHYMEILSSSHPDVLIPGMPWNFHTGSTYYKNAVLDTSHVFLEDLKLVLDE